MTLYPVPTVPPKEGESIKPFARSARPCGLRRWLPALTLVRAYHRNWLIKDLIAGLAVTTILVPVGMGYAAAASMPAMYGLYATLVPLVAYAIFGPSRILVLGPDSALAGLLAMLTGALCILAGLARFGFVTDLLSKPIRYGYLNGIAHGVGRSVAKNLGSIEMKRPE